MVLSLHRGLRCVYTARCPKQNAFASPLRVLQGTLDSLNTLHRCTLNSLENSAPTSRTCPPRGDWLRALMKNVDLCPEAYNITAVCVVRCLQDPKGLADLSNISIVNLRLPNVGIMLNYFTLSLIFLKKAKLRHLL